MEVSTNLSEGGYLLWKYLTLIIDSYSHFFTIMYLQLNNSKTLRCCITELQNDIDIASKLAPSLHYGKNISAILKWVLYLIWQRLCLKK